MQVPQLKDVVFHLQEQSVIQVDSLSDERFLQPLFSHIASSCADAFS